MSLREQIPMKPGAMPARIKRPAPFETLPPVRAGGDSEGSAVNSPACTKKSMAWQSYADAGAEPTADSPLVNQALRSPGQPPHPKARAFFDQPFGHAFGNVRIHADDTAAEAPRAGNAMANDAGRVVAFVPNGQPVLQRQAGPGDASPPKKESPPQPDPGSPGTEAEPSGSGSGGSGSAPGTPLCQPKGLDRPAFLAAPGTGKDVFGLTTLDGSGVTFPTVNTFPAKPHGVTVGPTSAALPTIPSVFTKIGVFVEGETQVGPGGGCSSGKYPLKWSIGTNKIGEAEQEHCNDFQYAFDISLKQYADAVNALAAKKTVFPNHQAVEAALTRTTGVAPAKWQSVFNCLVQKTKLRDPTNPGDPSWHTPKPFFQAPRVPDCKEARAFIYDAGLPEVGNHPSSEIIEGCGEKSAPAAKAGNKTGGR